MEDDKHHQHHHESPVVRICGGYSPQAKFLRSFGNSAQPSIDRFAIRNIVSGRRVCEYDFDVKTQKFTPRSTGGGSFSEPVKKVKSAYNGFVDLPLTGDMLVANVYYGGKRVQIAVYDAKDETEQSFMAKNFSSGLTINFFFDRVNNGRFEPAKATDPYSVNAFFSILSYYNMLFTLFGRVGLAGREHAIVSIANVRFTNAFWTGFCMVFGNAKDSGGQVKPLTSMDVCGHELSHGLQTFSTEFEYQGESGALNESIADVFGTFLEFYVNSPADTPDWTLGEQFQYVIRDFKDPKKHQQPNFYGGSYWVNPRSEEDNGGVHTNSGVTNFMCYLAIEGSPNQNFVNDAGVPFGKITPVKGFDLKTYTEIVYALLFSKVLPTNAGLKDFAREFCKIAQNKCPFAIPHIQTCAKAVGLLSAPVPSAPVPSAPVPSQTPNKCNSPHCPDYPPVPPYEYPDPSFPPQPDDYNDERNSSEYGDGCGGGGGGDDVDDVDIGDKNDQTTTPTPPPSPANEPLPVPKPLPSPLPSTPNTEEIPVPSSPSENQRQRSLQYPIVFQRKSMGLLKGYTNVGVVSSPSSENKIGGVKFLFDPALLIMANMYSKCFVSFWFNMSDPEVVTSSTLPHFEKEILPPLSSSSHQIFHPGNSEVEFAFDFSSSVTSLVVSFTCVFAPWLFPKGVYFLKA